MLEFRDFVPEAEVSIFSVNVNSLESAIKEMNEWLRTNEAVEMVNVETLLLPSIHRSGNDSSTTKLKTAGETSSNWYQIIRLWYRRF